MPSSSLTSRGTGSGEPGVVADGNGKDQEGRRPLGRDNRQNRRRFCPREPPASNDPTLIAAHCSEGPSFLSALDGDKGAWTIEHRGVVGLDLFVGFEDVGRPGHLRHLRAELVDVDLREFARPVIPDGCAGATRRASRRTCSSRP
jgi:hypothetical protein